MEDLRPRSYQEEIFSRARNENVIAALDTGSGKTFISTQLIKWVASQESLCKGKVILFLVPRVPLVEQQGNYLQKHTPLRVRTLSGEVDYTNRRAWRETFRKGDVFVMTPQIFLNLITFAHWSIQKVSLLIFDECHHTRKNHPFNGIMREYQQVPSSNRPKVFGMTASPVWNPQKAAACLEELEKNLSAKVIGVLDNVKELAQHAPKPTEVVKTHPSPPGAYPDYPSPGLYDFLDYISFPEDCDVPWSTLQSRYFVARDLLGPYAADIYLYAETYRHLGSPTFRSRGGEVNQIHGLLDAYQDSFDAHSLLPIPLTWCTPKIKLLVELLLEYYNPNFQGIVFVEQRHIAVTLGQILPLIPELSDKICSAALIGQDGISGVGSHANNKKNITLFRERKLNLLVATSVAEEGLDFPACDLVIRLDGLKTLISYVQSRGRARKSGSRFIVVVQEDDLPTFQQYDTFRELEPQLRMAYQHRHPQVTTPIEEDERVDDMDDDTHPEDLLNRERYVTRTSAILTYDNSITLIEYLCSLLPQTDPYLPPAKPKYTGSFASILRLPPQIPLPREKLKYVGPPKHSKKEAKRAVSFLAAKALHQLAVFDDYLLPAGRTIDDSKDELTGSTQKSKKIPVIMDVLVRYPWVTNSERLWLYTVEVDGLAPVGLVSGTWLPPTQVHARGHHIRVGPDRILDHQSCGVEKGELLELMERYTRAGLHWLMSGRKISESLGLYVVPLTFDGCINVAAMRAVVENPTGCDDWSQVGQLDDIVVMNRYKHGRPLIPLRIRSDLTPLSCPPPGSQETDFSTYHEFFTHSFIRNPERQRPIPTTGPLVEVVRLERSVYSRYDLESIGLTSPSQNVPEGGMLPLSCCLWAEFSRPIRLAFQLLPPICHRLTGVYRIHQTRIDLGLPRIEEDLMIQALTIPQSNDVYSNQRLETLGDAALQLAATVHVYNEHPYKHEGQLTILRRNAVCNKTLRDLGKAAFLEEFIISEHVVEKKWHNVDTKLGRRCKRLIPRRSLQDCVEAILGASYLTGDFPLMLQTGAVLGVDLGGPTPWENREYPIPAMALNERAGVLFDEIQASLGYTFRHPGLLLEACTHATFLTEDSVDYSYERLEFLGDAVLEIVVTEYLYKRFPSYNSGYLSRARARLVCASVLGYVAVRKLSLHKYALFNNTSLSKDLAHWVHVFSDTTPRDIVRDGWKYDPPKLICDVLESTLGAVFVDSGWNYDRTSAVTLAVMQDVLDIIGSEAIEHPMALLLEWCGKQGCAQVKVNKLKGTRAQPQQRPGAEVVIHDTVVVGPIHAHTREVAKGLAAEKALSVLRDDGRFAELCDCKRRKEGREATDDMVCQSDQNLTEKQKAVEDVMDVSP